MVPTVLCITEVDNCSIFVYAVSLHFLYNVCLKPFHRRDIDSGPPCDPTLVYPIPPLMAIVLSSEGIRVLNVDITVLNAPHSKLWVDLPLFLSTLLNVWFFDVLSIRPFQNTACKAPFS